MQKWLRWRHGVSMAVLPHFITAPTTECSSNMGDRDETVANKVTGVVDVEKVADQDQPKDKDAENEEDSKRRKAIAPRSDVWNHFTKVKIASGEERAKCKYCRKLVCCDTKTNGMSSMKSHLKICKKNPHKKVVDNQGTLQLQPCQGNSSVGTVSTWKFDPDDLRNSFAEMIIEDEQPFVLFERPGLGKFLAKACPRFVMPSRRTATKACVKVYGAQKEKLKKFIKDKCEQVSLTTDTWTANTNHVCDITFYR